MKVRNIFALAILCILGLNSMQAQSRLGVKVEYGIQSIPTQSKYLVNQNDQVEHEIVLLSATPAQSIGLFSSFDFGYIFLQPEALYTTYSVNYEIENFNGNVDEPAIMNITEKIQQFDLPIYAGIRYKFLKFGAGPVFHFGEHVDSKFTNIPSIEVSPTKISAGFQAGIGIDLRYVNLDVKYQKDFTNVSDHLKYNGQATGLKSSLGGIKVGIAFNLSR